MQASIVVRDPPLVYLYLEKRLAKEIYLVVELDARTSQCLNSL